MNAKRIGRWLAATCLLTHLHPETAIGAEPVNLSRYVLKTVASGTTSAVTIDQAILDAFCKDDDGCALGLQSETSVGLRASEWRLTLSQNFLAWSTSYSSDLMSDNDATSHTAGRVEGHGAACYVTDADLATGLDTTTGFTLVLTAASYATCAVILTD